MGPSPHGDRDDRAPGGHRCSAWSRREQRPLACAARVHRGRAQRPFLPDLPAKDSLAVGCRPTRLIGWRQVGLLGRRAPAMSSVPAGARTRTRVRAGGGAAGCVGARCRCVAAAGGGGGRRRGRRWRWLRRGRRLAGWLWRGGLGRGCVAGRAAGRLGDLQHGRAGRDRHQRWLRGPVWPDGGSMPGRAGAWLEPASGESRRVAGSAVVRVNHRGGDG